MEVEDVTRVGLTTGRPTQEQRHLTVRDRLLRQVVEDDEGVHAVVAEVLAEGAAEYGARNCSGAASDAVAATMIE